MNLFFRYFSDANRATPTKRNSCSSDFFTANSPKLPNGENGFSPEINTNFSSLSKSRLSNGVGSEPFNFGKFVRTNSSSDSLIGDSLPAVSVAPSVWSLDCNNRFVVLGCSNGRIEVWEIEEGAFQVNYHQYKYIF